MVECKTCLWYRLPCDHCDNSTHSHYVPDTYKPRPAQPTDGLVEGEELYLGNFGYPLKDYPGNPVVPKWAADFINNKLRDGVRCQNISSWAREALRILADMLAEQGVSWASEETKRIANKMK